MTAPQPQSISAVFGIGDPELPALRLEEAAACLAALKQQLPPGISAAFWPSVLSQLQDSVSQMLDTPMGEVMASAWRQYAPLLEYTDPAKFPPHTTSVVPLAKHSIKSTLEPSIELFADDVSVGTIDFKVELATHLEGAVLSIRNGRIVGAKTGSGTVSGKIACGECTLVDLTSSPFELPGEIELGDGIPLVPPA